MVVETRYRLKMRRQRSYSNLPEEIIFDILSRLPAKSVGLCRCVSNPWRTLLSRPDFIKTHLQITKINSPESLTMVRHCGSGFAICTAPLNNAHDKITFSPKLSFVDYNHDYHYFINGSCDGLLLVSGDTQHFVMNPLTREIRQLPRWSPHFGIDPCFSGFGFGYDSVRDDYKIVNISSKKKSVWADDSSVINDTFVNVYYLKTGSGKRLESFPYYCLGSSTAFVDGCLHFISARTTDNKLGIVALNLVDEKFRYVPHPSLISDHLLASYTVIDFMCLEAAYA